jgi:hypothetical protein
MSQFFLAFEVLFRSQSSRSASTLATLTAADGRPNVRSTSRMNMRNGTRRLSILTYLMRMGRYPATKMIAIVDFTLFLGDNIVGEGLLIRYWRAVLLFLVKLCLHVRWPVVLWPSGRPSDWPQVEAK